MKYTKVVNPSSTPQTITVDVPDPVITASGETPIETPPPVNHVPVVALGVDRTITLPVNSVTIAGVASDPDTGGFIKAYMWEKISGSGVIESPNSSSTKISGLTVGTSTFRLTAIDDQGASGFDEVNIIVQDAVVTPPPAGWKLIYANYFNTDADLDPFQTGQAGKSYIDKVNPITGAGSFRSRPANVSNGCRGEMQGAKTPTTGMMKWDTIYHYALKSSSHSFQFHPSTNGGSASPGLWHVGGKFVWRNWIGGKNVDHPCNFPSIPTEQKLSHRIEYSFGKNGYFKHWINDELVCSWTGQVGDNSGTYVKIGVNANFDGNLAEAIKSDVSYDNFEIYIPA